VRARDSLQSFNPSLSSVHIYPLLALSARGTMP
jgi:hypothetical protein